MRRGRQGIQHAINVFAVYALMAAAAGFLLGAATWAIGGRVGNEFTAVGGSSGWSPRSRWRSWWVRPRPSSTSRSGSARCSRSLEWPRSRSSRQRPCWCRRVRRRARDGRRREPAGRAGSRRVVDGRGCRVRAQRSGGGGGGCALPARARAGDRHARVRRAAAVAGLVATAARRACSTLAQRRRSRWSGQMALRCGGWRSRPIRSRTRAAGAQVIVLESWIYATAAREALWAIERVSLVWRHGDWRVSAITGAAPSANESLADLRSQLEFPGPGDASVR